MEKKTLDLPILPLGPYYKPKYVEENILYSGTNKFWLETGLCGGEFKFIPRVGLTNNLFYALKIAEEDGKLMKGNPLFEPLLLIVDTQKSSDEVIVNERGKFKPSIGKGKYYVEKLDIGSFLIEKTKFLTPILLEPYKYLQNPNIEKEGPRIKKFLESVIDGNYSIFKHEIESNLIYKSKEEVKRTTLISKILYEIANRLPHIYTKYETACLEEL